MAVSEMGPEAYDAYVAHANERDGWERWRVSDLSTDRETGAPLEPVRDQTPYTAEETSDLVRLVRAEMEATIDEQGRVRLRDIMKAHRFERSSTEDQKRLEDVPIGTIGRRTGRDMK